MGAIKEMGATLEDTPVHKRESESESDHVSHNGSSSGCSFSIASSMHQSKISYLGTSFNIKLKPETQAKPTNTLDFKIPPKMKDYRLKVV